MAGGRQRRAKALAKRKAFEEKSREIAISRIVRAKVSANLSHVPTAQERLEERAWRNVKSSVELVSNGYPTSQRGWQEQPAGKVVAVMERGRWVPVKDKK